jgi:preprotein translocase subunit SecD
MSKNNLIILGFVAVVIFSIWYYKTKIVPTQTSTTGTPATATT